MDVGFGQTSWTWTGDKHMANYTIGEFKGQKTVTLNGQFKSITVNRLLSYVDAVGIDELRKLQTERASSVDFSKLTKAELIAIAMAKK